MESHCLKKHRFSVFQDQVLRSEPERGEAAIRRVFQMHILYLKLLWVLEGKEHVRKYVPSETLLMRSLLMSLDF
jgi:hypothetical protein